MNKIELICGDCLIEMKKIPNKSIDLCLTDPPYGIGAEKGTSGFGKCKQKVRHYMDKWEKPPKEVFDEIQRISKNAIIFGGNYFTNYLPQNDHWIVWDKIGEIKFNNPFSKCELAWTNINKKMVEKYTLIQQGFIGKEKIGLHPTQKPVPLFRWILEKYSKKGVLILDPFMGSGTTGVACKELGRDFIGIEISSEYCEIARRRIDNTQEILL